ncbi:NAD(P)H-binding protein [Aureimonas populi]|uniref:NAD(P)H-binding protein n=1 Tax=Aureimonas populi TaxID=1701758 RepID=A0ABW5CKS8_9HYPH|nr:NAD(P)H-binding protein [Aureimonas populi]
MTKKESDSVAHQGPYGIDRRRFMIGGLALGAGASALGAGTLAARAQDAVSTADRRTIVVTTPTGKIGHRVVRHLLDSDVNVRIIARSQSSLPPELLVRRLPPYILERVEVVRGSHSEADVVNRAFEGADTVLWICPPEDTAENPMAAYVDFSRPASEAIVSQGVQRVVSVTGLGRGTPMAENAGFVTASLAMDDMIADTGVAFRALAMPAFIDNIAEQAQSIRDDGVFFSAIDGDLRVPACATRDIAVSAIRSLLDTSWTGRDQLAVLGPEDISFNEMAQIMTEVLERPVRFDRITFEEYEARFESFGSSPGMARGQTDLARAKNEGLDNAEPRTPENTTPTSFRLWCEDELLPLIRT